MELQMERKQKDISNEQRAAMADLRVHEELKKRASCKYQNPIKISQFLQSVLEINLISW